PFRGDTPIAVLMAHLTQQPSPLPIEFRSFQDVLDRMLAKDREARYGNLEEFAEDLKTRLISSNTLLMRLQLDPEQTSSEQLRALGFHTSTPGTGALRESMAGRLPSLSGNRSIIKPSATPAPPPAAQPAARDRRATAAPAKKWRLPAIAAAALVLIAVAAWFVFGHSGRRQLTPDDRDLVAYWLDHAQQRFQAGELVVAQPGGEGSALQLVQKAVQKDPGNPRAEELLDQIAHTLQSQAESTLGEGKFDDATALAVQALQARPEDKVLKTLKTRIAAAKDDAERKATDEKVAAQKAEADKEAAEKQAAQEKAEQAATVATLRERIGKALA